MTPQENLLSVLPRLMNLSNLSELTQENSDCQNSFKNLNSPLVDLENIQENEEDFEDSTKSNQKKKLRKKLRDIKKPIKKESSQKKLLKKMFTSDKVVTSRIPIEEEISITADKTNKPKQFCNCSSKNFNREGKKKKLYK